MTCEGCEIETCQDCCDHGDVCTDERICLDCDKDMTEDLMCAAYDYAKGRAQDGY